ncbi:transcription factor/nuclear export subunit protein 2-domain-containing protein [Mycena floridula]|nr:transcription factor/nuclear export subunit protein 2-domain-containing protein [Mycena floridula]
MELVKSVKDCLVHWSESDQAKCRNLLISPHSNPSDPSSIDILATAYQTLLFSTCSSWSLRGGLTPASFVSFVQSVIASLPSSSQNAKSSNLTAFGDLLVDMIWTLDLQLDEILADAKGAFSSGALSAEAAPSALISTVKKAKQNAENDKETLTAILKYLLAAGIVNPLSCRERLESTLLAGAGLIADGATLGKKEVRTRTGLFYKQNKFNLLREQSEGYSRLVAELTSGLTLPHSSVTARAPESYSVIEDRARCVWEKVVSLIGTFDMDPNRALDIILDVLSVHLATHYTFFLALLSFSPWRGSYCPPNSTTYTAKPPGSFQGKSLDEVLTLVTPNFSKPTPLTNNARVLAQVLGFKFTHYQSMVPPETAPKHLFMTAALLIREGLLTLEDLYPHLSPADENMEQYREAYKADVQSRKDGAKTSQLAMAAPLESAPASTLKPAKASTPVDSKKPAAETKQPPSQKASLLLALLSLGALKPAIWIMSKFPWLVDAHPEIADLMIRIMKHSLSPLYDTLIVAKTRNPSFTQPRARWSTTGLALPPQRRSTLSLWAPTPPSTSTADFVFFFPDWTQQVPTCTSLEDLEDVIEPFMRFVGLHISRDPLFVTKFLRLGRLQVQSTVPIDAETKKPTRDADPNHPIRLFWFKVLRVYLLPALSLIRGNAVCTVEIWNIVRQYETTARWRLYGEWKSATYKSHSELEIREVQANRESKGILRRLSHKTIDSLSGTVAKLAHANPCIFFTNAVNQIMAYDNLASVVIQALRYVTNMGFDVLVYIILDTLAVDRPRVKEDGVNIMDWLQSLASFTGMLFRRYSADITPVLTYVVHQLHNEATTEIVVLRELIWKLAGIEPLPSLSDSQIAAMAGGPALRIEAIASTTRGARLDPSDGPLKGPQRLGKALIDSNLAYPLLVLIAQQRQSSIFKVNEAYLKSLSSLFDTTHGVLLQYLELLNSPSVITPEEYASKVVPSIAELGQKYGIPAPICMQIIRPMLHSQILAAALEMAKQEALAKKEEEARLKEAEKRLKAALTAKREPAASRVASPSVGTPQPVENSVPDSTSTDVVMEAEPTTTVALPPVSESPWLPQLSAVFDDIKKVAPEQAIQILGPGFYVTFWQLSTYDLMPPAARYREESEALQALSRQEDAKYAAADRSADRAKRLTATSHRQRRDRYNNFHDILRQELDQQTDSRAFTIKRLAREKLHWFAQAPKPNVLTPAFIEHCIQPRCLLSPMDADYCVQMIKVIHTQGTPNFYTLRCYDLLLGDQIKVVLFSCSEYEARNYGRFLLGVLSDLQKWFQDEQLWITDNRSKVAGKTVIHPGFQKRFVANKVLSGSDVLTWSEFRRVTRKWHTTLMQAFVECIQTTEFMHVYNAIIVMKEILPVFPLASVMDAPAADLNQAMDNLIENEERGDLKILARAYSASLKKRETLWTSTKTSSKTNGTDPSKPSTRGAPTGPSAQNAQNSRNTQGRPGPRADQTPTRNASTPDKTVVNPVSAAKSAVESLRPTVVRRVRPEPADSPKPSPLPETRPPVAGDNTSEISLPPSSQVASSSQQQELKNESLPVMPPPAAPSQTPSAQELRDTAKQSIQRVEKPETKKELASEVRAQNGSAAPSPRARTPSPSSRPGTRNHSADSRASGGRSRPDPGSDDKRSDREGAPPVRRDSLTHNRSDRPPRERARDGDKDGDRDRDRGRDRHGERDHRDRDRDRERERDRERDRDRHRRDDKKDRGPPNPVTAPNEDRPTPTRPAHRNTQNPDDLIAPKRKRGPEDDVDRIPKRGGSSRKDAHREDRGGNRRPPDKDERSREPDRRRRDREGGSDDGRTRVPDGPSSSKGPPLPSGPRADLAKGGKPELTGRDRDQHRDSYPPVASGSSGPQDNGIPPSLRSRIGEKEAPSSRGSPQGPPHRPNEGRNGRGDGGRKRGMDSEMGDGPAGDWTGEPAQKRPKINRNRQSGSGPHHNGKAFSKALNDSQGGDRQRWRKD